VGAFVVDAVLGALRPALAPAAAVHRVDGERAGERGRQRAVVAAGAERAVHDDDPRPVTGGLVAHPGAVLRPHLAKADHAARHGTEDIRARCGRHGRIPRCHAFSRAASMPAMTVCNPSRKLTSGSSANNSPSSHARAVSGYLSRSTRLLRYGFSSPYSGLVRD